MSHTDIATANSFTIRKLHSPDGEKTFGFLTGIIQPNGDLAEMQNHGLNRTSAERRLSVYSVIDKVNGYEIRKHHSLDKQIVFGYSAAKDGNALAMRSSLSAARGMAGFVPPVSKKTAPKSSHLQNTPGYRADAQRR